jgi:hypothetical protein
MKRFISLFAIALIWPPASAEARNCRVNVCQQEIFVATPFAVAVGVPIANYSAVGYSYCPTPAAPNVTVNIQANDLANAVADQVVNKLNAAMQQNTPPDQPLPPVPGPAAAPDQQPQGGPPPAPTPAPESYPQKTRGPQPTKAPAAPEYGGPTPAAAPQQSVASSVFASKCSRCHNTADQSKGKPALIEASLTCEQRLAAIGAAVAGKMPRGNGPLDPDTLGRFITEMSKK